MAHRKKSCNNVLEPGVPYSDPGKPVCKVKDSMPMSATAGPVSYWKPVKNVIPYRVFISTTP